MDAPAWQPAQTRFDQQVAFFHGCYVNYNYPQLGQDRVRIFNAINIGVQLLSHERYGGIPLRVNGFNQRATKQALVNTASLKEAVLDQGLFVVTTSSSCTFALRDAYPHGLAVDTTPRRDRM